MICKDFFIVHGVLHIDRLKGLQGPTERVLLG